PFADPSKPLPRGLLRLPYSYTTDNLGNLVPVVRGYKVKPRTNLETNSLSDIPEESPIETEQDLAFWEKGIQQDKRYSATLLKEITDLARETTPITPEERKRALQEIGEYQSRVESNITTHSRKTFSNKPPQGLFEYQRLPFGRSDSPASFKKALEGYQIERELEKSFDRDPSQAPRDQYSIERDFAYPGTHSQDSISILSTPDSLRSRDITSHQRETYHIIGTPSSSNQSTTNPFRSKNLRQRAIENAFLKKDAKDFEKIDREDTDFSPKKSDISTPTTEELINRLSEDLIPNPFEQSPESIIYTPSSQFLTTPQSNTSSKTLPSYLGSEIWQYPAELKRAIKRLHPSAPEGIVDQIVTIENLLGRTTEFISDSNLIILRDPTRRYRAEHSIRLLLELSGTIKKVLKTASRSRPYLARREKEKHKVIQVEPLLEDQESEEEYILDTTRLDLSSPLQVLHRAKTPESPLARKSTNRRQLEMSEPEMEPVVNLPRNIKAEDNTINPFTPTFKVIYYQKDPTLTEEEWSKYRRSFLTEKHMQTLELPGDYIDGLGRIDYLELPEGWTIIKDKGKWAWTNMDPIKTDEGNFIIDTRLTPDYENYDIIFHSIFVKGDKTTPTGEKIDVEGKTYYTMTGKWRNLPKDYKVVKDDKHLKVVGNKARCEILTDLLHKYNSSNETANSFSILQEQASIVLSRQGKLTEELPYWRRVMIPKDMIKPLIIEVSMLTDVLRPKMTKLKEK
ncbi:hypothetical protein CPB86DRAFT_820895, partial [Serendipita vermifera]